MEDRILVLITTGSEEEAVRVARKLLDDRLIACANLVDPIRSLYRWKGEVCDDREVLLLCKSREPLFEKICAKVKESHSYEVPEIISLPIANGFPPYLRWIGGETGES